MTLPYGIDISKHQGTNQAAAGKWRIGNNGTYISAFKDWADGNWATTGAKAAQLSGFYEVE